MSGIKVNRSLVIEKTMEMDRQLKSAEGAAARTFLAVEGVEKHAGELRGKAWDSVRSYVKEVQEPLNKLYRNWVEAQQEGNRKYREEAGYLPVNDMDEDAFRDKIGEYRRKIQRERRRLHPNGSLIRFYERKIRMYEGFLNRLYTFVRRTENAYGRAESLLRLLERGDSSLAEVNYDAEAGILRFGSVDRKWLNEVKERNAREEGERYRKSLRDINIDYNAIEGFQRMYGFTEEEALLLYRTIEKLGKSCGHGRDSAAYINYVYGTLSTLCISYDARRWRMAALTPNLFQTKSRLYAAGLSSQQILDLQVLINLQHGDFSDETLKKHKIDIKKSTFCNETHADMLARCSDQNNDFSHQTIQITAFACQDMMLEEYYILFEPWAIALFNSSDFKHSYAKYEISFKGDIDSGRYSEADFQSDVDAINIYNRMRDDNESSINKIWTEYYQEIELGKANRAAEFFRNLGGGEDNTGIVQLDHILKKETFGSVYIQNGNDMAKEDIDKAKEMFVRWIFSEYHGLENEFWE